MVRKVEKPDDNYGEDFGPDQANDYTPDETTIESPSVIDEEDYTTSRKRKRDDAETFAARLEEREHQEWSDSLLDYFMLRNEASPADGVAFPQMPDNAKVDRAIDNEGHTALHWACAMGDIDVVKYLLGRNAKMDIANIRGETPLIRAALFSNCFDKQTWEQMVRFLKPTIMIADHHRGTVFHHIAHTAHSGSRSRRAHYYFVHLLQKLDEWYPMDFHGFMNSQDSNGDTAFHIVARNSNKCMKLFQSYGLASDIVNANGETVDEYIRQRFGRHNRNTNHALPLSSSPIQGDNAFSMLQSPSKFPMPSLGVATKPLRSSSSQNFHRGFSTLINTNVTALLEEQENQVIEKDAAIQDLIRAEQRVKADLSSIRTRNLANAAILEEGDSLATLKIAHGECIVTAEKLEEQMQYHQLHNLVRHEESSAQTRSAKQIPDKNTERRSRVHVLHLLAQEINKRVHLTKELVAATADAGMSEQGDTLKRTVGEILNKGQGDDWIHSVDEILEHIQEEKEMPDERMLLD